LEQCFVVIFFPEQDGFTKVVGVPLIAINLFVWLVAGADLF
jgi:hypothetical protein